MIDSILLEVVNLSLLKLLLAMTLYHSKRKLIKQDQGLKRYHEMGVGVGQVIEFRRYEVAKEKT